MAEIDILVEAEGWQRLDDLDALIRRAAEAALDPARHRNASVSVLLADDATLQRLNAGFRGKDTPTNVLSFPAPVLPGDPASGLQQGLGDIALAYETCFREAEDEGKTLADHLTHLVIHGTLHLLGHDHESDAEAEAMEALEIAILVRLGIADPYAVLEPEMRGGGLAP